MAHVVVRIGVPLSPCVEEDSHPRIGEHADVVHAEHGEITVDAPEPIDQLLKVQKPQMI